MLDYIGDVIRNPKNDAPNVEVTGSSICGESNIVAVEIKTPWNTFASHATKNLPFGIKEMTND